MSICEVVVEGSGGRGEANRSHQKNKQRDTEQTDITIPQQSDVSVPRSGRVIEASKKR